MGLLRILLALSVVRSHAGGPILGNYLLRGDMAVESFFMISGFYMALILERRYRNSYRLFITNRFLRIFPLYWILLVVTIVLSILLINASYPNVLKNFLSLWPQLHPSTRLYLLLSNIFILGQGFNFFFALNPHSGTVFLTDHFPPRGAFSLYYMVFIGQAWTLDLELLFYLMIPFVVRRELYLYSLLLVSLLSRIALFITHHEFDPWVYRFFPSELLFFLGGAITYRIYPFLTARHFYAKRVLAVCIVVFAFLAILFNFNAVHDIGRLLFVEKWSFYLLLLYLLPVLFAKTKQNALDAFIGELSYPIYLIHTLVIASLFALGAKPHLSSMFLPTIIAILSILLSIPLVVFIQKPLDVFRHERGKLGK